MIHLPECINRAFIGSYVETSIHYLQKNATFLKLPLFWGKVTISFVFNMFLLALKYNSHIYNKYMFLAVFRFMFFQSEGLYFLSNVILLIQQMSPCGLKVACLKVAYFWGKSVVLHKHRQVFYTLEREF